MSVDRVKDLPEVGEPFETDVGTFVIYDVAESELPIARVAYARRDAITHAKGRAYGAGLRVLDVASASYQADAARRWLVELQVEAAK